MKVYIIIIFFLIFFSGIGQIERSPTILVLNSQKTIVDKKYDSIAKLMVRKGLTEEHKKRIRESNAEFPLISEKEILFLEEVDISTQIPYGVYYILSYKFFEYYQNLLIFPAKENNDSSLEQLNIISEKYDTNWVVNIPLTEFYFENGVNKGIVKYQLYNKKSKEILIEKELNINDHNFGGEMACLEGTISCVIMNSIWTISLEVYNFMLKNKMYWR
ncbi:hypothetical protein KXJ69_10220 [Aureisphaera sp. CAU 1614]|uniref:Lipoprotein n=1 Tax=Halomarinibacterium sedimenti TaxID=2857106 RepID=A0A9X1FPT7_9FLAO|nr:hypothetical protein [Halomarinibacterium sedimenti]MBW2938484.1 hypothetical protein [Halomarinibacterium sedimenti]